MTMTSKERNQTNLIFLNILGPELAIKNLELEKKKGIWLDW